MLRRVGKSFLKRAPDERKEGSALVSEERRSTGGVKKKSADCVLPKAKKEIKHGIRRMGQGRGGPRRFTVKRSGGKKVKQHLEEDRRWPWVYLGKKKVWSGHSLGSQRILLTVLSMRQIDQGKKRVKNHGWKHNQEPFYELEKKAQPGVGTVKAERVPVKHFGLRGGKTEMCLEKTMC